MSGKHERRLQSHSLNLQVARNSKSTKKVEEKESSELGAVS